MNNNSELYHYGIKGMKWGVRRYQNDNGTLTPAGKKRYVTESDVKRAKQQMKTAKKEYNKAFDKAYNRAISAYSPVKKHREANYKRWTDATEKAKVYTDAKTNYKMLKKSYKQAIKDESKRILAGESFINKTWDILTDAHKFEAELRVNNREWFEKED